MKQNSWSYSALTAFEQCPRRFYLTRETKQVPDTPGEAALWGQTVHKHLEDRARDGKKLPDTLRHLDPMISKLQQAPGDTLVERRMTINSSFQPTDWRAKDAWCRSVVDIGKVHERNAFLIDWKTGKYKPENDQLELFAGMTFAVYPEVESVKTMFVWLKGDGPPTVQTFQREQSSGIWQGFIERVARLEAARIENRWPPRPSGLCKKWCPVGKRLCDYCGTD